MRLILLLSALLSSPALAEDVVVDIKLFKYGPAELVVPAGTTVSWRNKDAIEHSVTPDEPDADFGSALFQQDEGYRHHFERPGTYTYHCSRHPSMTGVIRVRDH